MQRVIRIEKNGDLTMNVNGRTVHLFSNTYQLVFVSGSHIEVEGSYDFGGDGYMQWFRVEFDLHTGKASVCV